MKYYLNSINSKRICIPVSSKMVKWRLNAVCINSRRPHEKQLLRCGAGCHLIASIPDSLQQSFHLQSEGNIVARTSVIHGESFDLMNEDYA